MTEFDPKAAGELLKTLGTSDEHSKKFGDTFLGSLLGQSRAFLVYLAAYVVVAITALKIFDYTPKELVKDYGLLAGALPFGAPLLLILVFSFIPAYLRARRETRQKQKAIAGETRFHPGYFRLTPYEESDRRNFSRLDGADEAVFNWLASTQQSLLYLSGASGAGKSSLLAASVEPRLRALRWTILAARLFGDPIERLRAAMLEAKGLFAAPPGPETGLRDLLALAAQARQTPLLLIVDQFEEFLILNTPEQRAPFAAFLQELAAKPIEGLRLLLVYRSDYRALIFKLALPSPILGKNWMEIAPYNRGEATQFLQSGGRELSDEALNALFQGLDRIEEARGVYRLITLNMVGLILERMGQNLDEEPERLVEKYLMTCLKESEGGEYARPVLEQMITEAGTKEPRTESALAQGCGMEAWQIKSALAGLETQGLARRLESAEPTWEVSHDIIARALGRLLGKLRPSLFQRVRPYVSPAVLGLWALLLIFLVPNTLNRAVEARVMKFMTLREIDGVFELKPAGTEFDDQKLVRLAADLARLPGKLKLNLSVTEVSNIDALKGLTGLTGLDLSRTQVSNIDALKGLTSLTELDVSYTKVSNIDGLKGLTGLRKLNLSQTQLSNIDALKGLTSLTELDVSLTQVSNIDALKGLNNLNRLNVSDVQVSNIDALKGLTSLTELFLSLNPQLSNIDALKGLTGLRGLILSQTQVSNIDALKGLTGLRGLILSHNPQLSNIDALKGLTGLTGLDLSRTLVSNIDALKGLTSLKALDLRNTPVSNIDALKGRPGLYIDWSFVPPAAPPPPPPPAAAVKKSTH